MLKSDLVQTDKHSIIILLRRKNLRFLRRTNHNTNTLPTIRKKKMRIFDIFKKKKTESTFPENELEKTLMKASSDSSYRNSFYTKLLWNDLVMLTNGHNETDEGVRILEKDTTVQFVTFENGQIPIFTSTNRIYDKGVIKEQVPFISMKGQDLFGFTKGATFILNPYSDYGKELIPQEIESLLNGSIFEKTNEMEITEDTEVLIGQPSKYPTELVSALKNLFKEKKTVKAAYLATVKMDKSEELPHLMIAIDIDGDRTTITYEAGPLAEKYLKNEIVDFIQIDNKGGGISDYFLNETKPFYKRK